MERQHIDTRAQRTAVRKSKTAYLAVSGVILFFVIVAVIQFLLRFELDADARGAPEYTKTIFMIVICAIEGFAIYLMPVTAVYLGRQSGRLKALREDTTFNSTSGLTYYRDILKGVSPATVSVLADLKIEGQKDVSATLLRLYDKKRIAFEHGRIVCVDGGAELGCDEQELYEMLKSGGITNDGIARWKNNRYLDAVNAGHITNDTRVRKAEGNLQLGCLIPLIMFIGVPVLIVVFMMAGGSDPAERLNEFSDMYTSFSIMDREPGEDGKVHLSLEDVTQMSIEWTFGVFILLWGDIILIMPCRSIFRSIAYSKEMRRDGVMYKRTKKGEELAEKIAGLQRFIHEFSNLSEAQKEQIVLWNDFLVYAVALEENEQIVRDIGRLYGKGEAVDAARRGIF